MSDINKKLKSDVRQIQMICDYLIKECEHDDYLAERVMLESKTIDGMYQYIMTNVKNNYKDQITNNGVMVSEEDVYSTAIHYFIEDDETLKGQFPSTKTEYKQPTAKEILEQSKNRYKKEPVRTRRTSVK